jgi:hypothetical protein
MGNYPLYIGQPADGKGGVRDVAKRTGRKLLHIDSLQGGEWVRVFANGKEVAGVQVSLKDCPPARYTYGSGEVVLFELRRRACGDGPLVYRVVEVLELDGHDKDGPVYRVKEISRVGGG